MRESLSKLIANTIIYEYSLPNGERGIEKVHFSTHNDDCFSANDLDNLSTIIYNAVVDYAFDEFDLTEDSYNALLRSALKVKLKYNEQAENQVKIKYGFYGEVLLYCLLYKIYNANCLISRGYFYNPLENEETKGYDSYHLIYNSETNLIELWFGEVKFHIAYSSAIKSVMQNIDKALSDNYLANNFYALINHKDKIHDKDNKIGHILDAWLQNPEINILNEIRQYNMTLVYPVFIIYNQDGTSYDNNIDTVVKHIKEKYNSINPTLSIPYKIFFVFMPIQDVKKVKETVIKWIEERQPLIQ